MAREQGHYVRRAVGLRIARPWARRSVSSAFRPLRRSADLREAEEEGIFAAAWGLDDETKAEQLIGNLARRLERGAPAVSWTIPALLGEVVDHRQDAKPSPGRDLVGWPAPGSADT